jgi:hypothetical protein
MIAKKGRKVAELQKRFVIEFVLINFYRGENIK